MTTINVTVSPNKAAASSKKSNMITKLLNGKMTRQVAIANIKHDPLLGEMLTVEQIDRILLTGERPVRRNQVTVQVNLDDVEV